VTVSGTRDEQRRQEQDLLCKSATYAFEADKQKYSHDASAIGRFWEEPDSGFERQDYQNERLKYRGKREQTGWEWWQTDRD